ncbi:MAG: outer membrane lipoprotein-sorting protein [Acidobacteriota bacterium]
MSLTRFLGVVFAAAGMATASASPLVAEPLDATEVVNRMHKAFFYQGESLRARVKMTLSSADVKQRIRELVMLRLNMPLAGEQRYFMYFHSPGDVRGMSFLVYKYPAKEDDRWLFIPALSLVQRVAARDAGSSFVGSDFTYEDVSGRDLEADEHKLLREEDHKGKPCFVIESVAKGAASYKKRISWIDKSSYLPLREEYSDVQGKVFKEFTAGEIREVEGIPTMMTRTMKSLKTGHQTLVEFSDVRYRLALKPDDFGERSLRNPPNSWIE